MYSVTITIQTTDNRTQSCGYDSSFYSDQDLRDVEIINDMKSAKERFGDNVEFVSVVEYGQSNAPWQRIYDSIDEVIDYFKPEEV